MTDKEKTVEELAEEFAEIETVKTDRLNDQIVQSGLATVNGIVAFRQGCSRGFSAGFRACEEKITPCLQQQLASTKHLLGNYIDPKSTPGQELMLSLERLEKILGE